MTGWAATNTLRDNVVTLDYYAKERHADGPDCPACAVTSETLAALALVEAALYAADVPLFLECITEPPCGDCPGCRLAAALRDVREGK